MTVHGVASSNPACVRHFGAWMFLLWLGAAAASDTTDRYGFTEEPRRLALIIGNANYRHLGPLASAKEDRAAMVLTLSGLQFKVTELQDVDSARDFEDKDLPQFLSTVRKGDIVLLYYTGHGFSAGAFSYLAPTGIQSVATQDELIMQALPVESLVDVLAARRPGLLIAVLDACRSVPGLQVNDPLLGPHPPPLFSVPKETKEPTNVLVGLAAKHDVSAVGYAIGGKQSVFTQHLSKALAVSKRSFVPMYMELIDDVERATAKAQSPGLLVWSSTDFYLHPSPEVLHDHLTAWNVALDSNNNELIDSFSKRFATSLHAAAARKWLEDHPRNPLRYTMYSPLAIERSWQESNPVVFASATGFGYPRVASANPATDAFSAAELGVKAGAGTKRDWRTEIEAMAQMEAVALKPVTASVGKQGIKTFAAGTTLKIQAIEHLGAKDAVLVAQTPELENIRLPLRAPGPATQVTALGGQLSELTLARRTNAKDLLQLDELARALASLRARGSTITWISAAAGATDDREQKAERAALLNHAVYALKGEGIAASRVSGVLNAADITDDNIRLRIFGY